ncbi:MAG: hypothetical protein ACJA2Q_001985 [Pseudohongiellaceae bacterium]|jgi:hypothetical protein
MVRTLTVLLQLEGKRAPDARACCKQKHVGKFELIRERPHYRERPIAASNAAPELGLTKASLFIWLLCVDRTLSV